VKALCWEGTNNVKVEEVPEPRIRNSEDVILKVRASAVCGSDLHLLGGYIPAMQAGDVLGHEFLGEVVEVGPGVRNRKLGDRVVVCSFTSCGRCWYCRHDLWSLCDNANTNPGITEALWGQSIGACFGYSHALGGFAGSHAEYIRVPFADYGTFVVPEAIEDDLAAVFASDAGPTGWMGAHLGGVQPGDVVAVWGAGGVGQVAARAALLLGAERVIAIDTVPERLALAKASGAITLDFMKEDVYDRIQELTSGRGADACIDAVGTEPETRSGFDAMVDRVKVATFMGTDRPHVLRQAIHCCRNFGTVSIVGVYGGFLDKIPMGSAINRGLTFRMAQTPVQHYLPKLLERVENGEIDPSFVITHRAPLEQGPELYKTFRDKKDGCIKVVLKP